MIPATILRSDENCITFHIHSLEVGVTKFVLRKIISNLGFTDELAIFKDTSWLTTGVVCVCVCV